MAIAWTMNIKLMSRKRNPCNVFLDLSGTNITRPSSSAGFTNEETVANEH
jgi:hypothetical protein